MSDKLKRLDAQLRDWGKFCYRQESSQAGNFGNSPSNKLIEGARIGLMSFGTSYLDSRSESVFEPEWFQAINATIQQMRAKHVRVLRVRYVVDPDIRDGRRFRADNRFWQQRIAGQTSMTPHVFQRLLREAQMTLLGAI